MLTMRLSELCDFEKWIYWVFLKPMPCSALTLPFSLDVHSNTNGSIIFWTSGSNFGVVTFKCRLPSPETWFIKYLNNSHNHLCCRLGLKDCSSFTNLWIKSQHYKLASWISTLQLAVCHCDTQPAGPRVRHDTRVITVKHLPKELIIKVFDFW